VKQEQQRTRRRRRRRKPTAEKTTPAPIPAKKKIAKPETMQAGSLREQVKAGNFTAREVLDWLNEQSGQHSAKFIGWLQRKLWNKGGIIWTGQLLLLLLDVRLQLVLRFGLAVNIKSEAMANLTIRRVCTPVFLAHNYKKLNVAYDNVTQVIQQLDQAAETMVLSWQLIDVQRKLFEATTLLDKIAGMFGKSDEFAELIVK
jgi:hypothetical protein